ncbi:unnamed protein product [Tuwongella immobilis]|uniref:Uncharacterized protein n=1 Tax=Tuwongella immobilis TaxID=692036 RepID=A0A6C2YPD9_9BACT|nr:unnamed protein product [Tuwongella immobilis]VTS03768.1 unnamed protein product [Tuwongella immobilis]
MEDRSFPEAQPRIGSRSSSIVADKTVPAPIPSRVDFCGNSLRKLLASHSPTRRMVSSKNSSDLPIDWHWPIVWVGDDSPNDLGTESVVTALHPADPHPESFDPCDNDRAESGSIGVVLAWIFNSGSIR